MLSRTIKLCNSGLRSCLRGHTFCRTAASDKSGKGYQIETEIQSHSILLQQYNLQVMDTQQVLVIQPIFPADNELSRRKTTDSFLMDETLGLVKTLGWDVVEALTLKVHSSSKIDVFFGDGQLDRLKDVIAKIESDPKRPLFVSGIFISTYRLPAKRRIYMEETLGKSILDRYNVVLQIFNKHARTKEAKLQVKLAEIPYLKARLHGDLDVENESKHSKQRRGDEWFERHKMNLNRRQKAIKEMIEKIKIHRESVRDQRAKTHVPTVAVVGYTNSGKTSLIKAITGSEKLVPENKLFATLDVTAHRAVMPSQLEAMLIDTVGFISDIPTDLIASFRSTLEDAGSAHQLVHVRDVSNPDHVAQNENVLHTLNRLAVPRELLDNMIVVGNKVDLLPENDWKYVEEDGMIPVSTTEGHGMSRLVSLIEDALIRVTGRIKVDFRVQTGGPEFSYLMQNVTIFDLATDENDPNYSIITGLVLPLEKAKYDKLFGTVA